MPQVCSLCRHAEREAIDAAIVEGRESFRDIAGRFGTSKSAVERHRDHVPQRLALAAHAAEETRADSLLEKTQRLETDARRLLAKAEADGDFRAAIAAVKTALDVVALLHRVAAEAREDESALARSPEWIALRTRIYDELERFPEALEAVREATGAAYRGELRPAPVVVTLKLPPIPYAEP